MNRKLDTRHLLLPALCLGGAAFLLAPTRPTQAFSKIGGSLGETQRDFRVFDNFLDASADDNAAPHSQFPGYTGLEMAIWKGTIEWGNLHGDGTGDPVGTNPLGSGGANFDPMWSGNTNGIGTSNQNIVSSLADCSGTGTLAFTETPISDGWRIRFCDEWTWDDGPGTIGAGRFDIQGVMCHEYGHALGLGHSGTSGATMFPSVGAGQTQIRSIANDDINGVQCVYGIASATKPTIVATVASGGTLTLHGSDFGATDNEVWFTNEAVTATSVDPIVRVPGLSSSGGGTVITLAIPAAAGPGDVIVNKSGTGHATVSNAFPTDLVGTIGTPPGPNLTSVNPSTITCLIPGTAKTIQLGGTGLDQVTSLLVDGTTIPATRWAIVSATRIDLDMPQVSTLGAHTLGVSDGVVTDSLPVTIVAASTPTYEMGSGDPGNVVDRTFGLTLRLAGTVGRTQRIYVSRSNLPSNNSSVNLEIGNNFTDLTNAGQFTIPAAGWLEVFVPPASLADPGPSGTTWYSQTIEFVFPQPFPDSNVQSILLVR